MFLVPLIIRYEISLVQVPEVESNFMDGISWIVVSLASGSG